MGSGAGEAISFASLIDSVELTKRADLVKSIGRTGISNVIPLID